MLKRNHIGDLSGSAVNEGIGLGLAGTKLATASGLIGTAPGISSGAAVGASSLGALAIPIAGVAIAALPFAINLAKCGTLTTIGCTKVSDSTAIINIRLAACQIAYAWEQGQISSSQAVGYLQQLAQEAASAFQRPTDWTSPSVFYTCCGSFSNNSTSESGPPCGSAAATVIPSGTSISGPDMINRFIAYVSGPQPTPSGTGAASLPGTVAAGSPTAIGSGSGSEGLVLLALGLGALWLLM